MSGKNCSNTVAESLYKPNVVVVSKQRLAMVTAQRRENHTQK